MSGHCCYNITYCHATLLIQRLFLPPSSNLSSQSLVDSDNQWNLTCGILKKESLSGYYYYQLQPDHAVGKQQFT